MTQQSHSRAVNQIVASIQSSFASKAFVMKQVNGFDGSRKLRYGVPGTCDIRGYLYGDALAIPFEIEVKTGTVRLERAQAAWLRLCARLHVPHRIASVHSDDDLDRVVSDTITWLRSFT